MTRGIGANHFFEEGDAMLHAFEDFLGAVGVHRLLSAPRAGLLRLLAKFKLDSVKEQFLETVECLWVVVNLDHHAGHLSLRVIAYLTRPLKRHRDSEHRSRVLLRRQAHHDKGLVAHGQRSSTRSITWTTAGRPTPPTMSFTRRYW